MIHAEQKTAAGIAILCDAEEADLKSIIDYWYASTEEYLVNMGVDHLDSQHKCEHCKIAGNNDPALNWMQRIGPVA